jgi:hypothetical protein
MDKAVTNGNNNKLQIVESLKKNTDVTKDLRTFKISYGFIVYAFKVICAHKKSAAFLAPIF